MTTRGIVLVAGLGAALASGLAVTRAQQPDTDREVEEAKALYREANFSDAILKLQSAIEHLKLARDLEAKRVQLGDAYLHMALSYFALDNRAAARETLKGMLRLDRERRLDPQIYAPPVIELLEDARGEVAAEAPAPAQPRGATSSPPTVAGTKRRSKTLPIVLGVGGAAVAGIVVAAGGGGAGLSGTTPSTTATPTPTPTPAASGRDIVFLGSSPPPGSTISLRGGVALVTLNLSVTYDQSGPWAVDYATYNTTGNAQCVGGFEIFSFIAGRAQTVSVPMRLSEPDQPGCDPPFTTAGVFVNITPPVLGSRALFTRTFPGVSYTFAAE